MYGYDSIPFIAESGVPQGSNLGPLLFVFFVNDLLNRIKSQCLAYADDIKKIYKVINTENDCLMLQEDIELISNWCSTNLMSLNIDECHSITFTKKTNWINHEYNINGKRLVRVSSIRDLVVLLDSELSFRCHYEHMVSKCNRMLGFIKRLNLSKGQIA